VGCFAEQVDGGAGLPREVFEDLPGGVGAAVVDEEELDVGRGGGVGDEIGDAQAMRLVVARDDDDGAVHGRREEAPTVILSTGWRSLPRSSTAAVAPRGS